MREKTKHVTSLVLGICILLQACAVDSADTPPVVTIAAASSLTTAFNEIGEAFTIKTGIPVVFSYASTGALTQQIRNGAPFDLFAAADATHIDALIEDQLIDGETRAEFCFGQLVLILDPSSANHYHSFEDLTKPEFKRIAIANPAHAPYGIAAESALRYARIWDEVQDKIIYAETVRQAVLLVETGNAPAGIVSASLEVSDRLHRLPINPDYHDPIVHVLGVLHSAVNRVGAASFRSYLSSPEGKALLLKHLLLPPTEP